MWKNSPKGCQQEMPTERNNDAVSNKGKPMMPE
jgi:hypothetical protein